MGPAQLTQPSQAKAVCELPRPGSLFRRRPEAPLLFEQMYQAAAEH